MHKPILFLIISVLAPCFAFAADVGIISGKVLMESKGEALPLKDAGVRLKIFKSKKEVSGAETRTNSSGTYRFEGLDTAVEFEYQVHVDQEGVPFSASVIGFKSTKKVDLDPIEVHAVTGDTENIRGRKIVMIETGQNNIMKITESILIRNIGDLPYDGRKNGATPLYIDLKSGGFQLQFLQGLAPMFTKIEEDKHRLRLTNSIKPGTENELRIEYAYLYEYKSRSVEFNLSHSFPLETYTVVLMDPKIDLNSQILTPQPPQNIEGKAVAMFRGENLQANTPVSYTVKGMRLPKDTAYALLFGGLAIVALLGLFMAWKKPRQGMKATDQSSTLEKECLSQLESLERSFRLKKTDSEHYEMERERLMEILYELRYAAKSTAA